MGVDELVQGAWDNRLYIVTVVLLIVCLWFTARACWREASRADREHEVLEQAQLDTRSEQQRARDEWRDSQKLRVGGKR